MLKARDKIIWYSSREKSGFIAIGTATSDYRDISISETDDDFPHEFDFELDSDPPPIPKKVESIKDELDFIKNKSKWWSHFQNPRRLSKIDFEKI